MKQDKHYVSDFDALMTADRLVTDAQKAQKRSHLIPLFASAKKIFFEELDETSTIKNLLIVRQEVSRTVKCAVMHCNLDAIIARFLLL